MAGNFTQANRRMAITTPLGADKLLLTGIDGTEGISQLFRFELTMVAETATAVPFDKLLGQPITIRLNESGGKKRFINGICSRVGQGDSDEVFTAYTMEVVPSFWLLTRRAQCRIFQHLSVVDILKKVLTGLDVAYEIQGTFHPRDFCVQYRETDFNFACRMMEEEGIYFFFKHADGSHQAVLANTPGSHKDLPDGASVLFQRNVTQAPPDGHIFAWFKRQEARSGKVTLFDHCFELPHQHLDATKSIQDSVDAGSVTHKLAPGSLANTELYDYPGEYAQRFDGVDKGGGEQAANIQKIFEDNVRTVGIRMQQEATPALTIFGGGDSVRFTSGFKFAVTTVAGDKTAKLAKAEGSYVITTVSHSATQDDYRSGDTAAFKYQNGFTCIPVALPFRPQRDTPKPFVQGLQTGVVVGPAGQEIFTDKYGRVKVQFHWDREGKNDADSSCWIRVAQAWAGKRWGASFWPRIGQEVIVAFEEGDPDRPIIVGSVYNADQMPPYLGAGPDSKHANDNKVTGVKSNTTLGGAGFNEWRFDDTKDKQQIFFHAERNMDTRVKNDSMELVIHDRHLIVGSEKDGKRAGDQKEKVFQDKHLHVLRNQDEKIDGNLKLLIGHGVAQDGGNVDIVIQKIKKELIEDNAHLHVKKSQAIKVDGALSQIVGGDLAESVGGKVSLKVKGDLSEKIGGDQSLDVAGKLQEKVGGNHALEAQEIHLKAGMKVIIEAGVQLSLKGPGGFVDIGPSGVTIQGIMVLINSGGSAGSGSGCSPKEPADPAAAEDAQQAAPVDPAVADDAQTGAKSAP